VRAAAVGLEGVPALAAAEVQDGHPGAHVEQVVVDGQHARPLSASTRAYQSAVRSAVERHV
jgi:hypothetical protein